MSAFTQGEINDMLADFTTLKQRIEQELGGLGPHTLAAKIASRIVAAKVSYGGYDKQCSTLNGGRE